MFGYMAFPSIYGPNLTGIAGTARANDCLRPGVVIIPLFFWACLLVTSVVYINLTDSYCDG
jgi:hypothetical protein